MTAYLLSTASTMEQQTRDEQAVRMLVIEGTESDREEEVGQRKRRLRTRKCVHRHW